jgi:hypothetical protein
MIFLYTKASLFLYITSLTLLYTLNFLFLSATDLRSHFLFFRGSANTKVPPCLP